MDALDRSCNKHFDNGFLVAHSDRHPSMRFSGRVCLGDLGYGIPTIPGDRFDHQRCHRLAMGERWWTCAYIMGPYVYHYRLSYQSSSPGVFDVGNWGALFDRWSFVDGNMVVR